MADTAKDPAAAAPTDLLAKFIEEASRLPGALIEGTLQHAGSEEERVVIRQFAGPLATQFSELLSFVTESQKTAGASQLESAGQVLRLSAAAPLAAGGVSLASDLSSPASKIGLSAIIELVKKIIRKLVEIFHINLPSWFNALVELIDEIVNFILSLGSTRLANTLSSMHQNSMAELAQLARLQQATQLDPQPAANGSGE